MIQINHFGLTELSLYESVIITGGGFWTWLGAIGGAIAITALIFGSGGLFAAGIAVAATAAIVAYYEQNPDVDFFGN